MVFMGILSHQVVYAVVDMVAVDGVKITLNWNISQGSPEGINMMTGQRQDIARP